MANYVGIFKMKATEGNGEKIADILRQVPALNMPGCIKFNMAIDGDTICGYEEWESKEAHTASLKIPEVMAHISQAFQYIDGKPEMLFEGESI
ncbi:antibiotic biosynthesis monooxygenase [Candidatus Gracilibacteria bacterium]|nr:antibiotic biosynthesis monooxygenase [Candidatus Gracilibacteria bacterium]